MSFINQFTSSSNPKLIFNHQMKRFFSILLSDYLCSKLFLVCFVLIFKLKMTNKLILIALILCVSSSVDSLKLTNICKDYVFEYNGLKVNSFLKMPQKVSLDPNRLIAIIMKKIFFFIQSDQYSKC